MTNQFIKPTKKWNEYLKNYGGHIGYSIAPSERRQGYGKAMLQACLAKEKY